MNDIDNPFNRRELEDFFSVNERDDFFEKIHELMKREQPSYQLLTHVFFNLAINAAILHLGWNEVKVRSCFSAMLEAYLESKRIADQRNH
jgi:hypothetical protein